MFALSPIIGWTGIRTTHREKDMFEQIKKINERPEPFQFYTAAELWTHAHTSKMMLEYHLNESIDVSSRNKAFIDRSSAWIASEFNLGLQIL